MIRIWSSDQVGLVRELNHTLFDMNLISGHVGLIRELNYSPLIMLTLSTIINRQIQTKTVSVGNTTSENHTYTKNNNFSSLPRAYNSWHRTLTREAFESTRILARSMRHSGGILRSLCYAGTSVGLFCLQCCVGWFESFMYSAVWVMVSGVYSASRDKSMAIAIRCCREMLVFVDCCAIRELWCHLPTDVYGNVDVCSLQCYGAQWYVGLLNILERESWFIFSKVVRGYFYFICLRSYVGMMSCYHISVYTGFYYKWKCMEYLLLLSEKV